MLPSNKKHQIIFMIFLFIFVVILFNNPLWRDKAGATKTLEKAGYQNIQILPYQFFSHCGRIGPFKTNFTAQKPDGKTISGKVCQGFFADPYIKMD